MGNITNRSYVQERYGRSVLHHAVVVGSLPVLLCLIGAGADLAAADSAGNTAAAQAAAQGTWPLADALLKAARDLGEAGRDALLKRNCHGLTALHYAIFAQYAGTLGDPAAAAAKAWARAAASIAAPEASAELLQEAEKTVATARIADVALLNRHRGDEDAVIWGLDGLVVFRNWASVVAGCSCPAGERGYFEVEVLRPCRYARAGFCAEGWPGLVGKIVHLLGHEGGTMGVGGDIQSWGIGGEAMRYAPPTYRHVLLNNTIHRLFILNELHHS
jgi:hypothetical protein